MQTFTAVIPTTLSLPDELKLLLAPIRLRDPGKPDEFAGRTEGAILDVVGDVVGFFVRLSPTLVTTSPRTIAPASAFEIADDDALRLLWTEGQLLAQPRLDANLQPHNMLDGGRPIESQWMPARPNVVPPGEGVNGHDALKDGIGGSLIGAALGALAGMAVAGPIGAVGLAGFFAAGGGLAGLISGASQETAPEASELKLDMSPIKSSAWAIALRQLARQLGDPGPYNEGLLHATRFMPLTKAEPPREVPLSQP